MRFISTVSRHMPLHSFYVFRFYKHSCHLTRDGKRQVAKIILHITEKLRQVKKSKTPKCVEALGVVFEGTLCIQQNQGFCLCCPADGLIQPWYNKCFGLPFAEIIIIVVMTLHLYLYWLCLAFAEKRGSAMPEMVLVHRKQQLGKLHCPGPPIQSHSPKGPAAGLLQSFASLVKPRQKTFLAAGPQKGLLPSMVTRSVSRGASGAASP